ncbi:Hypothetical Protein FCC1311_054502 [Hondaea fermentalgiana]|uniref:Uncharacterized protein n=1 Tax=Hondaea fermentalgiana TaxID=2315210 RepID=A0A2R5GHN0_9STRA|nr:Hypothetical Protein FCC1311_054502 [Hondaea fermentalgiana]|eukprot:GBG29228.1 Hypothetical Protein FCC1311_054502 [Hondaea fermentalgiana]
MLSTMTMEALLPGVAGGTSYEVPKLYSSGALVAEGQDVEVASFKTTSRCCAGTYVEMVDRNGDKATVLRLDGTPRAKRVMEPRGTQEHAWMLGHADGEVVMALKHHLYASWDAPAVLAVASTAEGDLVMRSVERVAAEEKVTSSRGKMLSTLVAILDGDVEVAQITFWRKGFWLPVDTTVVELYEDISRPATVLACAWLFDVALNV